MSKYVMATLECSQCNTEFEIEEQSQTELDARVKNLNEEEEERLCDCCEQGHHFPSHDDIDSELQNANWADHTGFYISVECSKCGEGVDVNFEMTEEDFEVVH